MCVRLTFNFDMHRIVRLTSSGLSTLLWRAPFVTMTTTEPPNGLLHRNVKTRQSDEITGHGMTIFILFVFYILFIIYIYIY